MRVRQKAYVAREGSIVVSEPVVFIVIALVVTGLLLYLLWSIVG